MPQQQKPVHCRSDAYAYFAQQLPLINTTQGLERAATAIAMHQLVSVDVVKVEARLDALGEKVKSRVHGRQQVALLAHLHDVLFDEERFSGAEENYYTAENSYLPCVLETRRGLPITLTLIYKAVAERVGLRVQGINAPGHFMAGVEIDGERMLVDPYFAGEALSQDEALERVQRVTRLDMPLTEAVLPVATHRQWLARMLHNLQNLFERGGTERDLGAMLELRRLLD